MAENHRDELAEHQAYVPESLRALAPREPDHPGPYPHHSHAMQDDQADALSRLVARLVPLVFGIMLGAVGDMIVLGAAIGLVGSLAFDLSMEQRSWVRAVLHVIVKDRH